MSPTPTILIVKDDASVLRRKRSWFCSLPVLACATFVLQGCVGPTPVPPSPTPNPNPQKTSLLKISVQSGSDVDKVEVSSIWAVGNIGCAPIAPISGAAIMKQVLVAEKVEKVGSDFLATSVDDRFITNDECRWKGNAYQVSFMHGDHLLVSAGAGPNDLRESGKIELTCTPDPALPLCYMRNRETFLRNRFKDVFNATIERVK